MLGFNIACCSVRARYLLAAARSWLIYLTTHTLEAQMLDCPQLLSSTLWEAFPPPNVAEDSITLVYKPPSSILLIARLHGLKPGPRSRRPEARAAPAPPLPRHQRRHDSNFRASPHGTHCADICRGTLPNLHLHFVYLTYQTIIRCISF